MEKGVLWLYNVAYPVAGLVLSPYLVYKLSSQYKYRAGLGQKLGLELPNRILSKKRVWFHAVSVGETQAVAPFVTFFKKRYADVGVYFSTTTYTGMDVAKKSLNAVVDEFFYFPFDFYPVVRKVLERISPNAIVIVETEIWPTLLYLSHDKDIPVFMINGRISDSSFKGYMRVAPFLRPFLQKYRRFYMRSKEDASRIVLIGAPQEKVVVTGNIKFYSVYERAKHVDAEEWRAKLGKKEDDYLWVCGSTHAEEEFFVLDAYRKLSGEGIRIKLCIAPRHPERFDEVASILSSMDYDFGRRSRGDKLDQYDILLLDTVGELFSVYSIADVVFIGGSLVPVGGHNPLESLVFGKPTAMGPHYFNFEDVVQEMENYINIIHDAHELATFVKRVIEGTHTLDIDSVKSTFEKSYYSVELITEGIGKAL